MADYEYWDADTGEGVSEDELYEQYDEMLDDAYGEPSVAGASWSASYVLQELDPIAYRVYFHDWLDSQVQDGILLDEEPSDDDDL